MPIEIKDLVGLSKPLERLVEVVSGGIGAVSKPYLIRKTADAKAYEIKVIALAMADSQQLLTHSEYEDGKIKVVSPDPQSEGMPALSNRITARLQYQDLRQQQNVEAVCANAAEALATETSVPAEKPEPEWVSRFMDISADISTEELQYLWGKILAGEIKKPGAYSLRTLDVLRNISKKEIESFVKLGNYVLRSGEKVFYIDPTAYIFTKNAVVTFSEILALKEAGLIFEVDLEFSFRAMTGGEMANLIYGPIILFFEREKDTPKLASQVGILTKVGAELLDLITIEPDMEYASFVGKRFHADGIKFAWAPIIEFLDEQIRFGKKTYIEP